jgi:pimeloyl-ACP methyl ester carboxylesterase
MKFFRMTDSTKAIPGFRLLLLLVLVCGALLSNACLKAGNPKLPQIFPSTAARKQTGKPPIIIVPGVLGSQLTNRHTGEKVWPNLFVSDNDTLALPITSDDFRRNTDDLIASDIVETAKFAALIPEISVYDSLLTSLERYAGYRRGDIDNPPTSGDRDTFYIFAYDWRRDNVESAQLLMQKVAILKQKLSTPDLKFDIIAHSMGGLVARYFAMYGGSDVLANANPSPDWNGARHINRLFLLGTPNAGSMDALRTLVLGYSATETNRVRISLLNQLDRDSVFTTPSAYQLLPRNASARFLDVQLAPLHLDLFDIETWSKYKWSAAFNVTLAKKERKAALKEGGEAEVSFRIQQIAEPRIRFLRAALARAAAFQRALDATVKVPDALKLYLLGGDCEATLDAVMIVPEKKTGQPLTLFQPSRAAGNRSLRSQAFAAMFAPGDGRVTRRSLFGLKLEPDTDESLPRAMKQKPTYAVFSCEVHGDLPLNLRLQNNLLTVLLGNSY